MPRPSLHLLPTHHATSGTTKAILHIVVQSVMVVLAAPVLEWLVFGRKRDYLDGAAGANVNVMDRTHVMAVMILDGMKDFATLKRRLTDVFLGDRPEHHKFYRLKQYPVLRASRLFWAYWREDHDFDASRHIIQHDEAADHTSLEEWIAVNQVEEMDPSHPLFQFHIFERYTTEDGAQKSAVVFKIHHCYADGFGLLRVLMQGADLEAVKRADQVARATKPKPSSNRESTAVLRLAYNGLIAIRKLLTLPQDPVSPFKAARIIAPGGRRHVAWHCMKSTVQDLKVIGRQHDATVNDVLLTALTGALRAAFQRSDKLASPIHDIHTAMWVSLNPLSDLYKAHEECPLEWTMSTLGVVYVRLPLASAKTAEQTLSAVKASIRQISSTPEAFCGGKLLSLFGRLPPIIARPLWNALSNNCSASASNMPGPQQPMAWLGMPVESWLFFVRPQGTVSLFVTMATFNGKVCVGLGGDASVLEKNTLRRIVREDFERALDELRYAKR